MWPIVGNKSPAVGLRDVQWCGWQAAPTWLWLERCVVAEPVLVWLKEQAHELRRLCMPGN